MYLENVGYHKKLLESVPVGGAIFAPSAQTVEQLLRKDLDADLAVRLFDPQLYILDLDVSPSDHAKLLARLATYSWFGLDAPRFESAQQTQREWSNIIADQIRALWSSKIDPRANWANTVQSCIDLQEQFGVSSIILPATLLADPDSTLDEDFSRLDEAIQIARRRTRKPLLASLPIDENLVRARPFMTNSVLDALADGASARRDLAGVYIPFVSSLTRERLSSLNAAGAMLRLSNILGNVAQLQVVVNFVEILGIACIGVGATAYGSGYGTKQRRFCISDFKDTGGGTPLPKLLSLELVVDALPERDLERIRDARLLHLLSGDRTDASSALFEALGHGRSAADVPAWEERRNNVAAAKMHYVQVNQVRASTAAMSGESALQWLQNAEAAVQNLEQRFRDDPLTFSGSHLAPWRRALEAVLDHDSPSP